MPIEKLCEECGTSYRIPPSRASTSRFCCIACANAARVVTPRRSYYKPKPGGLRCAICGDCFWALGVHVKHKHGICAKDYKAEYGMLLTTPLVHAELSEEISSSIRLRLADPEYKAEVTELCLENAKKNKGKKAPGLSQAASELLAQRNRARNDDYLKSRAAEVQAVLDRVGFVAVAARELSMAITTINGMAERGLVSVRKRRYAKREAHA